MTLSSLPPETLVCKVHGVLASDYEQMPLSALRVLVRVVAVPVRPVASRARRLLHGFHALAVHDGRGNDRVPTRPLSFGGAQHRADAVPRALQAEAPEVVEDCLPGRKIVGNGLQ